MNRGHAVRVLGTVLLAASLTFVALRLRGPLGELSQRGVSPGDLVWFACALLLYLAGLLGVHLAWAVLVNRAQPDARATVRSAFIVASRAQIAKYLPGNVFHLAGRQALAAKRGWSQSAPGAASAFELIMLPMAALLVVVVGSATLGSDQIELPLDPRLLALGGALAITAGVLLIFKLERLSLMRSHLASWRNVAVPLVAAYVGFFVLGGLAQSVMLPGTAIATAVVASATAWIAGYVTPGAPAGVGVREAVFLVAIGQESLVITVALIGFRLVSVTADLIVFLLGAFIDRRSRRTTEGLVQQ